MRKTDFLLRNFDPGILWDDFGIRSDIVVCYLSPCFISPLKHFDQPFTHFFPRANIHELLAPDLLHQLIKGVFKDHLVEWIGEYLVMTHGLAAWEQSGQLDVAKRGCLPVYLLF